jgi:predicted XRE-type DNA-binding protein
MKALKQIAEIIKKQNPTVGEVLEDKIKDANIDAFANILSNFIKLNYPTLPTFKKI